MQFRKFLAFTCLFLSRLLSPALVLPAENVRLNYTNVYFEENLQTDAFMYELFLYADSMHSRGNNFSVSLKSTLPAFRVSDLSWGISYYWRVRTYDKDQKLMNEGTTHRFGIVDIVVSFPNVEEARFEIKTNKEGKHAGGLLMIDYTRCIYDRRGRAVWTLPNIQGLVDNETQIRDMKLTYDNTITFLTEANAVEIDLNGNVLWKAPPKFVFGGDTVVYHHDLKKTKRGTYIVLGNRRVNRLFAENYTAQQLANEPQVTVKDKKLYKKTQMTVLLEFDKNGKLIWFWDANTYITDKDLMYKKNGNSLPILSSHSNAFSESEDGKTIYVGFRDLSRIVKINKASKKVSNTYGEKFPSGEAKIANSLFRKQHDGTITKRGTLLIFNNNEAATTPGEKKISSIIEIKENPGQKDSVLLWSFPLNYDSLTTAFSPGGGNIIELPNSNLLLCAGSLNRIFEVTRDKEIVWDALLLLRKRNESVWNPFPQYRCSWLEDIKEYHFIFEFSKNTDSGEIQLNVINTGNSEDFYTIRIMAKGKSRLIKTTGLVGKGKRDAHMISQKLIPKDVKNFVIKISSVKGNFSKELAINL